VDIWRINFQAGLGRWHKLAFEFSMVPGYDGVRNYGDEPAVSNPTGVRPQLGQSDTAPEHNKPIRIFTHADAAIHQTVPAAIDEDRRGAAARTGERPVTSY